VSGPGRPGPDRPGPDRPGLGARLRALLPAGLRALVPGAGTPARRPGDRSAGDAADDAARPGRPDEPPPFVVPDDVWNRPRASGRPAGPFRMPRRAPERPDAGGTPGRGEPGAPRRLFSLSGVARALWRLGRGHADGLDGFNATVAGFLASLLPLLLLALLMAAGGAPDAARGLAGAVVGLLAPPVLSHALATRWGREREWLRYAVAVNWCQWALPMLFAALLLLAQLVTGGGDEAALAVRVAVLGLVAYWLWLNWFIARHALSVPAGRAALLVFLVSLGSGAMVLLPQFAAVLLARG